MEPLEQNSATRLQELGYTPALPRKLHSRDVIGLSLADVSPTMAVLLLTAGVFSIGGMFGFDANLILGVIVLMIAMCLAELSAIYPIAGGMYSLVGQVLPAPIKWITLFNYLIQGVITPASIALGLPTFLRELIPNLPVSDTTIAVILLLICGTVAYVRVEIGAWVAMVMVAVELTVLSIITVGALLHPHQSVVNIVFKPELIANGHLQPVTFAIMLATLAPAFNVINGYDAVLGFSEELIGGPRVLARSVIIASALASATILIPLLAAMISAPDLVAFFKADAPVVYAVQQSLGHNAGFLVAFGTCIALFNAMLSQVMYFARVWYTTGRDNLWWPAANRALARLNRFHTPGLGVILLTIFSIILVFMTQLNWLIIFNGTVIAVVYLFVGIACIWSRIKSPQESRPYRLPLWPLPPLIVVAFTGFALVTQEAQFLIGEIIFAAIAVAFWGISKLWNRSVVPQVVAVEEETIGQSVQE